ncbi:MAG TPA: DNA polymerase I [Burkholderiales bacterium]|nr:DNA polymerase I [Burkholderiales bacterium]
MEKTLLLVDGSSYLYRAFHALPDLRNAAGEPTGAIYGVLNMLRKLLADYRADYLACVFDARGRTFRDELYDQYKANRPPMPDDLGSQVEPLLQAIRAWGWPLLQIEGVEADDVIATLAREADRRGMRCVISTGDKDLAQLVTGRVTLVNTMSNERLDPEGVKAKFGVPPERMLDYLTLVGDSVDNVPGVEKVGPKTAAKWVSQYGSLEEVMSHAGEIGGAVGENLRKALPWLPRGRQLLAVKCDVKLPFELEELKLAPRDEERLAGLLSRFGFKSWLKEAPPAASADPAPVLPRAAVARRYETLFDEADLSRWLKEIEAADIVSLAAETTSEEPMQARIVGLSFATAAGRAAYLPLAHRYAGAPGQVETGKALAALKPWLESAGHGKLGYNIKFDQHVLANHGVALGGIAHDALLESYVLESSARHDVESLAERHLGAKPLSIGEVTGTGAQRISFDQVDVARAAAYSAEDADMALQLHAALRPRIAADDKLARIYGDIEMPVREVLFGMERAGVLIDGRQLEAMSHELGQKMLELEARAHKEAGQPFNLGSPKQIAEIFFVKKGIPVVRKTPSGAPSTDEDVLEKLALDHPLARMLLDHREISKLKSTYTDKLPRMVNPQTGRVHTTYSQAVAVTGRLSSNDPNLQNIPVRTNEGRRIREAFVAPQGCVIVSADYSQVELRIMAHISGDENLLRAFAAGEDIHRATAAEVFGRALPDVSSEERRYAKVINFGLIYGMSPFGLARNLGIERSAAQQYVERYFQRYPGVRRFMDDTRQKARERGYVETVFGRRLYLPDIRSGNPQLRQYAERSAINAPMQGTAADIIKRAMISVHDWCSRADSPARLIMQVHDELVLEVRTEAVDEVTEMVRERMVNAATLTVPLRVDAGTGVNWDEAH